MREDDEILWDDDDDWGSLNEEPDCGRCSDAGVTMRGERCRSCRPTRFEAWWSNVKWSYQAWRFRREYGGVNYDEEAPF